MRVIPPSVLESRATRGFSLIEVMVALVILALGLLGFGLLQTMNLRYTQSADYRTRATDLAYELLDQMRANKMSADEFPAASFNPGEITAGACPRYIGAGAPIIGTGGVVARWQCQVVDALGEEAAAEINFDRNSGLASVVLTWGERSNVQPSTSFAVETYL